MTEGWKVTEEVGFLYYKGEWKIADDIQPLPDDDPRLDNIFERRLNETVKRIREDEKHA